MKCAVKKKETYIEHIDWRFFEYTIIVVEVHVVLMTLTETWDIENELDIAVITKPKSHICCCKGNALKNRENLEPENTSSLRGSKLQCCRTRKITTKIYCISRFYGPINLCLHTSNSSEWTKAKQSVVGKACSEEWLTAWRFLHATMYFLIYVLLFQPCHKIQFRFCHQIPYCDETPCQTSHEDFFGTRISQFAIVFFVVITSYFLQLC